MSIAFRAGSQMLEKIQTCEEKTVKFKLMQNNQASWFCELLSKQWKVLSCLLN